MLLGLDMYWGNGALTPAQLAGKSFAILKAFQGLSYGHSDWLTASMDTAAAAGVERGAYHYGTGTGAGEAQAAAFLAKIESIGIDPRTIGLALDYESNPDGADMTPAQARAFVAELHDRDLRVGLYHGESSYPPDAFGADWRWVAHWGVPAPVIPFDVHQYSAVQLDLDRTRPTITTRTQLRALWLSTPPPPPPEDDMLTATQALQLGQLGAVNESKVYALTGTKPVRPPGAVPFTTDPAFPRWHAGYVEGCALAKILGISPAPAVPRSSPAPEPEQGGGNAG